jgi:hypothetical protein
MRRLEAAGWGRQERPSPLVAEYARIAKMRHCGEIWQQWNLHWTRYTNMKPVDPWTNDAGFAFAAARRGKKLLV